MKYHGFESPIDWSQYLIQKADKHEYEPSEPGKRVEALLEKLYLPQNSYSYAKFPQWFADSSDKGTEEEQVRYVMNHLCPNLYHFYKNPTQKDFRLGPDVVNLMVHQHMCENTQATILNEDGSLYQDGVHDTHEEFLLLTSESILMLVLGSFVRTGTTAFCIFGVLSALAALYVSACATRERYFYIEKDELKFIAKTKEMFGWLKNSKPAIGCFAAAGAFIIMAISLIADIGIFDSGLSRETLGALINVAVLMLHIAGGCIVASVACAVWDSNKI